MVCRKVLFAAAGILLLVACATAPPKTSGRVRVVTTLGILADWARQVGGDRVEVTSLLTGNESPHTFEAKPQDAVALTQADILFRVGLGLEEWLDAVVENAGNGKLVVVDASAGITDVIQDADIRPKSEVRNQKAEGRSEGSGVKREASSVEHRSGNPHIWLDPELAKIGVDNLVRALVSVDPRGESLYRKREAAYFARLDSLSAVISTEFAGLSDRRLITYHDAWPYFARRFGLDIVATVEPIPGQEPSARELARLVDMIRSERVKVVTTEPQLPSALPDMLAKETGVRVVSLNPLESGGGYIAALGASAKSLADALR